MQIIDFYNFFLLHYVLKYFGLGKKKKKEWNVRIQFWTCLAYLKTGQHVQESL